MALAFKRVEFNIHYLKASEQEHRSPAFLQISPRGTAPVLRADGVIIRDSVAILAWLDRAYPQPPLFGRDTAEAARIWPMTMQFCDYLRAATDRLLTPIFFDGAKKATPALVEAARGMKGEFSELEAHLDFGPFLAGASPSAADAIAFPEARLVQRAIERNPKLLTALGFASLENEFPALSAWLARLETLPGVDKTMPPHWRD